MADVGSRNLVLLLGYLGADPELQTNLNTSGKFCVLSVATKEKYKTRDGKPREPTTWHRCIAWGKVAEIIAKYGKKGTLVDIQGKIQRKQWETKDGDKRQRIEISVDSLTIVGGKLKRPVDEEPPEENPEEDEIGPEEQEKKRGDDPY